MQSKLQKLYIYNLTLIKKHRDSWGPILIGLDIGAF